MNLDAQWVSFQSKDQPIPAFRARQVEARHPLPGLVVIHELWGVNSHIEDVAGRFAVAGYEALAPDLWAAGGQRPEAVTRERVAALRPFLVANPGAFGGPDAREAALTQVAEPERSRLRATMAVLMGPDEGRAQRFVRYTEIMRGAVAWLRAEAPDRKVGAVGFCMGGGITGLLACTEPTLDAGVVFYGAPPPADQIDAIVCPLLGHYADPDPRITPAIPAFAGAMAERGKHFESHVYSGAPHGFFNDTSPTFRADAARAAWARTLAFLFGSLG